MARYIDVDKAIEEARLSYCKNCNSYNGVMCRACSFDDAMLYIDNAPTEDVVPRAELDAMRGAANSYKMHYENAKTEVVNRVIDEFKELAKTYLLNLDFYPVAFKNAMLYAETNLKKKYTEGE